MSILGLKFNQDGTAEVDARSPTGRITKATVKLTLTEYNRWASGAFMIQDAMPNLSADERELFLSGFGKEEWDTMFKDE